MAAQLIKTHRENAEIFTGPVVCEQKLKEFLNANNIPSGFIRMVDIQEFGYNKTTGFMWLIQTKKVEHKFIKMKRLVSYDIHVTAFVETGRMKKIEGIKFKEIIGWFSLNEIFVEDPDPVTGKFTITNYSTGISQSLPLAHIVGDEGEKSGGK